MIMRNNIIELLKGVEVEWKALGEVAKITIGEFIHQNNQAESAKYPVYNGGISPTGYYNNFNNRGHKIIVSARGANAGFVNRISKPYWAGNSCYSIGIKDYYKLNWIFIYYFLKENEKNLIGSQQKGSIPSVSKKQMEKLQIPIPPLHVQTEIVRILDKFTALTAELTAELTARKKQYNYYRDKLLTFKEDEVEWKALGEICSYVDYRGKTPQKTDSGVYLITAKNIKKGYIDYQISQEYVSHDDYSVIMKRGYPKIGDVLITTEAPCGNVAQIDREDIALAQRVIKYRSVDQNILLNSFLKIILLGNTFQNELLKVATGSTVKGVRGSFLHKIKIPIPSLSEQARIVEILDKFDALTNSITEGLPREIALRQKQYEYYRNLLLDFPKVQE